MKTIIKLIFLLAATVSASAQNTVTWVTNATDLPALVPVTTRPFVAVGNESDGWAMFRWNSTSTATTNLDVVAYTGSSTGRWFRLPMARATVAADATVPLGVVSKQQLDSAISTISGLGVTEDIGSYVTGELRESYTLVVNLNDPILPRQIWYYDAASIAASDGLTVLVPDGHSGPGRYVLIASL